MLAANHDVTGILTNVSETGGVKNRAGIKLGVSMLKIEALEKPVEGLAPKGEHPGAKPDYPCGPGRAPKRREERFLEKFRKWQQRNSHISLSGRPFQTNKPRYVKNRKDITPTKQCTPSFGSGSSVRGLVRYTHLEINQITLDQTC